MPFQLIFLAIWMLVCPTSCSSRADRLNRSGSLWAIRVISFVLFRLMPSEASDPFILPPSVQLCEPRRGLAPSLSLTCCLTLADKKVPRDVQHNLMHCQLHLWLRLLAEKWNGARGHCSVRTCEGKTQHSEKQAFVVFCVFLLFVFNQQAF